MYDLEYLRQLHKKEMMKSAATNLYTDEYVLKKYCPGQFRPSLSAFGIRLKERYFASEDDTVVVFYSRMDDQTIKAVDDILKSIKVEELSKLSEKGFAHQMADLYADLDFCHPFYDGNSRALRAFISEVADEAGFTIDWDKFDQSEETRDILYAARDSEVNRIALQSLYLGRFKDVALQSLETLENFKSLGQLFSEIIQVKTQRLSHQDYGVEID